MIIKKLSLVVLLSFAFNLLFSKSNLIPFKKGNNYGFLNSKLEIVISPYSDYIFFGDYDYICLMDRGDNISKIFDENGGLIYNLKGVEDIYPVNDEVCFVRDWGADSYLLNIKNSNKKIESMNSSGYSSNDSGLISIDNGKYISSDFEKLMIDIPKIENTYPFHNERAVIYNYETRLYSVIDQKGIIIIPNIKDCSFIYSEGLLPVKIGKKVAISI